VPAGVSQLTNSGNRLIDLDELVPVGHPGQPFGRHARRQELPGRGRSRRALAFGAFRSPSFGAQLAGYPSLALMGLWSTRR
jgi:hypothetical protein